MGAGMTDWRIYYGDGETYDGDPESAPAMNVQAIVQTNDEVGREILSKYDFYIFRDDKWMGVDWFGLVDQLMDLGILKTGRTMRREEFTEVYRRAKDDPDFPTKSARLPEERH